MFQQILRIFHGLRAMEFYFLALAFLLDRFFKFLALGASFSKIVLVPKILSIQLYKNYGVGLNIPLPRLLTILLSVVFIVTLVIVTSRTTKKVTKLGLLLIIIGAVGNLIDRIVFGYVLDYISILDISFINISDLLIFTGVLLLLIKPVQIKPVTKT